MRWNRLCTLLASALVMTLQTAQAQEVHPYAATYTARASGLAAKAERRLESRDGNHFRLSQAMEVRVLGARLGTVEESSEFHMEDSALIPQTYTYRRTGLSSSSQHVQFDWERGIATSREDDEEWTLTLSPDVLDRLSFQLALRLRLADPALQEVTLQMVDADDVETHLYRVTATEVIDTGLGRLDTLKVERIRAPDSKRRTTFWLARDWHLLLVRFEQVDGSGSVTELSLEEATIAGQQVSPLP